MRKRILSVLITISIAIGATLYAQDKSAKLTVIGDISKASDGVLEAAYRAAMDQKEVDSLSKIFPIPQVFEFKDGRIGDLTGYNGRNAVFTLREPETREISIDILRKLNLTKE